MKPFAALLSRHISAALTSPGRRQRRRRFAKLRRILRAEPAEVHYFHQTDDPYSHLAVQILPRLAARYRIKITPHLVSPPDDAAAPQRDLLLAYARRDAVRLARRYGLSLPQMHAQPQPERIAGANALLAGALAHPNFVATAVTLGNQLWKREPLTAADPGLAHAALSKGDALRTRLGHYLGGMFYFEGEWYWGIDRLHHLEARLDDDKLIREPGLPPVAPFQDLKLDGEPNPKIEPLIEFWFSFRSPYSFIAAPRLHQLARHYGAKVRWRFILPMVMRGLPVPRIKRRYIMLDVKREAEVLGLPFGTVVDPVGKGAQQALAVLHRALQLGLGAEFTQSALKAAFADGLDLGQDQDLLKAAGRAGLGISDVQAALADATWQDAAEDNRRALFEAGLWGAPSYRVNAGAAHWGQDRLWALEEDLKDIIDAAECKSELDPCSHPGGVLS